MATGVEKILIAKQDFRPSRGRSVADKTMMFLKEERAKNRRRTLTFYVEEVGGSKRVNVFGSFRHARFVAHKMRLENHTSVVVKEPALGIALYELGNK